jgi:hypothetical protein
MLELPENWDDEGALRIDEATWERATEFLRKTARQILAENKVIFLVPMIHPCPNGSIDLHWKNSQFELLLNIPPLSKEFGDFYGETKDGLTIKGAFRPELHNQGIISWLSANG